VGAPGDSRVSDPFTLLDAAQRQLSTLLPALDAVLGNLDADAWRARPAPGEWAPVEILCHLRDEEVEDFGARLQVVVGGGTSFTPIDPERWAVDRRYEEADPGEALGALRARRTESLRWLASLDSQALRATSRLPQGGALGGLDLLAAWVCHDRLHLAQLGATLARQWATAWPSLRVGYAGPIPYEPTGRT